MELMSLKYSVVGCYSCNTAYTDSKGCKEPPEVIPVASSQKFIGLRESLVRSII